MYFKEFAFDYCPRKQGGNILMLSVWVIPFEGIAYETVSTSHMQ